MSRLTPGPWTVSDDPRVGISVGSKDSELSVCCLTIAAVHERSPAVARANAALIAAAPRLAATLRDDVITDDVFNLVVNGHLLYTVDRERMERAVIESLPALYARVRMVLGEAGYER